MTDQMYQPIPQDEHEHTAIYDQGLQFDMRRLLRRRHLLKMFGGGAALVMVGCSDDQTEGAQPTSAGGGAAPQASSTPVVGAIPTSATTPLSACVADIPEETAGPFPGDGSNGPNALAATGIVRSDITSSFGTSTAKAAGVPLVIKLTLVDTANACKPMPGAAVYLWHCDREGRYSMYSQGVTNENYLRGVQVADAKGQLTFTSVFPGAYSGRWPHVHFEIYPSLEKANSSKNKIATSQLALPKAACDQVYATAGYEASVRNMTQTTLQNDNVFRDGYDLQLATMTGSATSGMTAELVVGV